VQYSQSFNLSLEERVRRRLILAGILPKRFDLGQGAIGEAIDAAGAGQFGNLHKEALKLHDRITYNKVRSLSMNFIHAFADPERFGRRPAKRFNNNSLHGAFRWTDADEHS
jgi:hypothetical protein